MKILVAFPFSAAQRRELDAVAQRHGKHEVQHFTDAASAVGAAAEVEVLIGRITPELCLAAPHLRWGNYFGAGLERLLTPEVVALPFTLTNMAGKFAVQGAEHAGPCCSLWRAASDARSPTAGGRRIRWFRSPAGRC